MSRCYTLLSPSLPTELRGYSDRFLLESSCVPLVFAGGLGLAVCCFSHDDIVDPPMKAPAGLGAGRFDAKTNVARAVPYVLKAIGGKRHGAGPRSGRMPVAGQHAIVAAQDLNEQDVAALGRLLRMRGRIDGGACLKIDAVDLPGSVRGNRAGRDDVVLPDHDRPVRRIRLTSAVS